MSKLPPSPPPDTTTGGQVNDNSSNSLLGLSQMDVHQVQCLLDEHLLSLKHPWKGSIKFKFWPVVDKSQVTIELFKSPPEDGDICDYLGGQKRQIQRLYFSPTSYPPPKIDDHMKTVTKDGKRTCNVQGWIDLKRDIETSALDGGNPVISNGSNGRGNNRVLQCQSCGRAARKSTAMEVTAENPFRDKDHLLD